jgi:hypothetical protein
MLSPDQESNGSVRLRLLGERAAENAMRSLSSVPRASKRERQARHRSEGLRTVDKEDDTVLLTERGSHMDGPAREKVHRRTQTGNRSALCDSFALSGPTTELLYEV